MNRRPMHPLRRAIGIALTLLGLMILTDEALATAGPAWPVAGRQGLIQVVIVPEAQARDREAYDAQIERLCPPQATCFLNFFTNSTGAVAAVPLPDAIAQEPTALFRRSVKQAGEYFRWSCRMGVDASDCF